MFEILNMHFVLDGTCVCVCVCVCVVVG